MRHIFKLFFLFLVILMAGCSGSDGIEIAHQSSSVSGEQAGLVGIVTDKPASLSVEEKTGQWTIRVKVQLTNKKKVAFAGYQGATFELRLLDKDGEQTDFEFTPGATDSGREKADTKLMDLMVAPVGTAKEFVFHYTTDDKDEKNEIEKIAKEATGVEIINFDFMAQVFVLDDDGTVPAQEGGYAENGNTKEIEAYVLHFQVNQKFYHGHSGDGFLRYKDNYKVTIHMNGDVDIHMEIHDPGQHFVYEGNEGKPDVYDYKGAWAQRSKTRGANYVDYYDIEFNDGFNDRNWCVDNECKYLYFSWDAFDKKNPQYENKITKVDTLYVE